MDTERELLAILQRNVSLATGCTEPLAVAYNAARAKNLLTTGLETISRVELWLDPQIYRNGTYVCIPGVRERGLDFAAALGLAGGKAELGLQAISRLTEREIGAARDLIERGLISLHIKEQMTDLYIELRVVTASGTIQAITVKEHDNVVAVNTGPWISYEADQAKSPLQQEISHYTLPDFIHFATTVPLTDIIFLQEGLTINRRIAREGLERQDGLSSKIDSLIQGRIVGDCLSTYAQELCAAASEMRMRGSLLPVMTCAGSGNQGITVFLTLEAAHQRLGFDTEKMLRSLALACLLTVYIKARIGVLSAMCGCGVAAGIGASAAIVYAMDGNDEQILGAAKNMVGSISGMVCDGAKEGCAFKLALAAGWAVQAAFLSLNGAVVQEKNGIVANDFQALIENLGYICNPGMTSTSLAIFKVMKGANL